MPTASSRPTAATCRNVCPLSGANVSPVAGAVFERGTGGDPSGRAFEATRLAFVVSVLCDGLTIAEPAELSSVEESGATAWVSVALVLWPAAVFASVALSREPRPTI